MSQHEPDLASKRGEEPLVEETESQDAEILVSRRHKLFGCRLLIAILAPSWLQAGTFVHTNILRAAS